MDSEWRKTTKFIYRKVLEGSGKFQGHTERVRNILEAGGTGPTGPAPPGEAHQAGQAEPSGGGRVPPSLHASWRRGRSLSSPLPSWVSSFLSYWLIGVWIGLSKRPCRFAKPWDSRVLSLYIRDPGGKARHTTTARKAPASSLLLHPPPPPPLVVAA